MTSKLTSGILIRPKVFGVLAAIALLALTLFAWYLLRPSDDVWARLQKGGALRVAVDPSFPPFDDVDDEGRLTGFDIDLAQELGQRLGVPVEFKAIAFDGLVDAVIADKADVVISAFPYDPRLTEDVRYSQPYFEGGLVLVTREGNPVTGPEDLVGRTVAVEWGSLGDAWARANAVDVRRQETASDALDALAPGSANGQNEVAGADAVDAALVDAVTAALSSAPGLVIRTPPLESDPYVIVLSAHAPILSEVVDAALSEIMTDGAWEQLVAKHFALIPPKPELFE